MASSWDEFYAAGTPSSRGRAQVLGVKEYLEKLQAKQTFYKNFFKTPLQVNNCCECMIGPTNQNIDDYGALLVLQKLCWRRRAAAPPGLLARLFPQEPQGRRRKRRTVEAPAIEELEATSGCKVTRPRTRKVGSAAAPLVLPDELFWKCLSFWGSSRDPAY